MGNWKSLDDEKGLLMGFFKKIKRYKYGIFHLG